MVTAGVGDAGFGGSGAAIIKDGAVKMSPHCGHGTDFSAD